MHLMEDTRDISVLIPLYRGRNSVRACIDSLAKQVGVNLEIILLDNGCPEDTGEWAGYYLAQKSPALNWTLLEEPANTGFAAAMNRLYSSSEKSLVCFLNQDVVLEPDHLANLARALQRHENWAGVCGTLFRSGGTGSGRMIDTTGHVIFRDRIVRNRGAGKAIGPDGSIRFEEGEVFGLSAACALYRRDALESCREPEGPFDPDFFAYFEDIDLDFRLRRAGWELGYTPDAVGSHELAGSGGRRELGIRLRAYGNRRRLMWKHETVRSLFPDLGPVIMQEIYGWLRALVTDPIAWFAGPWWFCLTFPSVLRRRRMLKEKLGNNMSWLREWLKSETERFANR